MSGVEIEFLEPCIYLIKIYTCPTATQVDNIINYLLKTNGRIIVHAKHAQEGILMPTIDVIYHIYNRLTTHKSEIENRLIGTVIHARHLDELTNYFINIALTLYKPMKPVCITDDNKKVIEFINRQLN